VHTPSGFYYQFGAYSDEFSPGHLERIGRQDISRASYGSWPSRLQYVTEWLHELKGELDAPDLWAELSNARRLSQIASSSRIDNSQFTIEEKEYIIHQLGEIKQHLIAHHQLQLQQAEAIEHGFQNIVDAMNRFGKKDWVNYAVGFLLNFAVATIFSPQAANDMLHSFMKAVSPLFDAAMKLIK